MLRLGYSGGAATTSAILNPDPTLGGTVSVARVDYFSPGVINGSLFQTGKNAGTQQTFMARGDGFFDGVVNLTTAGQGKKTQIRGVGHNLNRALASGTAAADTLIGDVSQNACNPRCTKCNGPVVLDNKYNYYHLLDDSHLVFYGNNAEILDLEGHVSYITSQEKDIGVAGLVQATNVFRIAYSDRQSENESGHRGSTHVYVVDWKDRREIATLKFVQNALPVVHGGGLQLEALGMSDFSYALAPDGKKFAVLSMNSLTIYDLP